MTLAKARVINYNCNSSFIVLVTVITIVNYDCKTFKVQATGQRWSPQVDISLVRLNRMSVVKIPTPRYLDR